MATLPEGWEWVDEQYGLARDIGTGSWSYTVGSPLVVYRAPSEDASDQLLAGLELLWALGRRSPVTPYQLLGQEAPIMRWVRCQVIGQLGTRETLTHTLALTVNGDAAGQALPVDAAELRAVAELVRNQWGTFWSSDTTGAGTSPRSHFTQELSYVRVGASVVERTAATSKTDPDAGQVATILPTEYAEWLPPITGSNIVSTLPFQCAFVVSLLTRERGPRNRGRLYLGPVASSELGAEGKISANTRRDLCKGFGANFVAPLRATTPWQVTVVSGRGLIGHEVVRTAGGLVIDTQRRRREALPELPTTEWTSATI